MKKTLLAILLFNLFIACQQEPTSYIYTKINIKLNKAEDKISADLLFKIGNDSIQSPYAPSNLSIGAQSLKQKENKSRGVYYQYKNKISTLKQPVTLAIDETVFELPFSPIENIEIVDSSAQSGGIALKWTGEAPLENEAWQLLLKEVGGSLQIFDFQPDGNSLFLSKERFQRLPKGNYKALIVRKTPIDSIEGNMHYFGQIESKSEGFEFVF